MSLDDLVPDDAGDAKGGRPTEERTIRDPDGDPFIPDKNTKEYWQNIWDTYVDGEEPDPDEIAAICDYVHLFPWDVKVHLEEHGIYSFSWEHMPGDYPPHSKLARQLESHGVENDFVRKARREIGFSDKSNRVIDSPASTGTKGTSGSDNSDGDDSSGLMGLVEDAKGS